MMPEIHQLHDCSAELERKTAARALDIRRRYWRNIVEASSANEPPEHLSDADLRLMAERLCPDGAVCLGDEDLLRRGAA